MASATLAFVTGGNHGLGYEIVKALLQSDNQYHVFLASRSLEKARQAIELLHNECPGVKNTVEAVEVDLTSDKAIENALKHVQAGRGYIDVLINNAGKSSSNLCGVLQELTMCQELLSIPTATPEKYPSANASQRPTM